MRWRFQVRCCRSLHLCRVAGVLARGAPTPPLLLKGLIVAHRVPHGTPLRLLDRPILQVPERPDGSLGFLSGGWILPGIHEPPSVHIQIAARDDG